MIRPARSLALAAVAAALSAVAAAPATAQDDQPPPPEYSAVAIPPGQIDAAVAQLDGVATDMLRRTGVPGMAIAVVHDDRVVYAKGFGVRDAGTDQAVDADTVFQLASVSKSVGATVVSRAVGEGTVTWNDPVRDYLPWFRLSSPASSRGVTLADLYAHRSGLPGHVGDDLEDIGYGREAILRRLRFVPVAPIRAEYEYTNFGLTAAAEAVARAEGVEWAALSERTLYRPAGMRSTSSRYADFLARDNRALLHARDGDRWEPLFTRDPDAQSPAGGVSSSVNDMARWMRLQLNGGVLDGKRLVAEAPLLAMHTPHAVSGPPATLDARPGFYGLGMNVGTDSAGRQRVSHSGAFLSGAGTAYTLLPSADLGIVVLTNGQPIGLPEAVAAAFMDLAELGRFERDWLDAYRAAFEPLYANPSRLAGTTRPADPKAARALRAYAGGYANGYVGKARFVARGGRLTMHLGPRGATTYRLRHWDGDTFSYLPRGENALGPMAVTFSGGDARAAAKVTIEPFTADGAGTLRRGA